MWAVFSKWGSVGDVITPQKREKRGKQFGFVRFKKVDEDDKLLKALEQVWNENYKIKINNPRSVSKRRGAIRGSCKNDIRLFDDWIREIELVDLPLIGRNFTWYQYGTMRILDRFLISHGWLLIWSDTFQSARNIDFSDHCLIVLRQRKVEMGLIPFHFNNCWLKHHNFAGLVSNSWCEDTWSGRKAFIVKEKLKALKGKIKLLNKDSFGCLDSKLGQLSHAIQELDIIGENSVLNSDQLCCLKKLTVDWSVLASRWWKNLGKVSSSNEVTGGGLMKIFERKLVMVFKLFYGMIFGLITKVSKWYSLDYSVLLQTIILGWGIMVLGGMMSGSGKSFGGEVVRHSGIFGP
ncbi:hypothetical protein Lal_00031362 [Lupinus albus]|nr:hypothetical protein Lal_00031362 [Lupinus albus]